MSFLSAGFSALSSLVETGGPVVALLLVLSVLSLAVMLYKCAQFLRYRLGREQNILARLRACTGSGPQRIHAEFSTDSGLLARLCLAAANVRHNSVNQPDGAEAGEESLAVLARAQSFRLQSGFRILESIAQVAPLLGLFGTVLGMIDAFQALQNAGSAVDPSLLAGGIWVALLTTAVGLGVAMPTTIALTFFESRVARHEQAAEEALSLILNPAGPPSRHQETEQGQSRPASYLEPAHAP